MHLAFTAEQIELRDSARAALARDCAPSHVRDVVETGIGAAELGKALAWRGWPALPIDVDLGGLGQGFAELAVVLEELGRAAAPGPFLPTMALFVPAVRLAGTETQAHRFLAPVAAGGTTGTVALHEDDRWAPLAVATTAQRDDDGWVLTGRKLRVVCGAEVDDVVVPARAEGRLRLFVVPAAELTARPQTSLDPTRPLSDLDLDGVWVPGERLLGRPDDDVGAALTGVIVEGSVACSLDALGACAALLDAVTADALRGVSRHRNPEPGSDPVDGPAPGDGDEGHGPSGAVRSPGAGTKHVLGAMAAELETARAATYRAVAAVAARDPEAPLAAATAACAVAGTQAAITAGVGGLHEQTGRRPDAPDPDIDVDLWCRRALASTLLVGTPADHRGAIAATLLDPPAPADLAEPGDDPTGEADDGIGGDGLDEEG